MKLFSQYANLRKEMYILAFGRVVTSMGATIWPMLTLILSNKFGMTANQIAQVMLVMGILRFPCLMIGGKLADRFNKRNVIVLCDLVTVASYCVCGFIGISSLPLFLIFFFVGSIFGSMEYPSYDALVADLTRSEDRERAYSLNYLAVNLGMIAAPLLGGALFKEHLNLSFFITAVATLSSTVLIFFFIKDIRKEKSSGVYEANQENLSTFALLKQYKILVFFALCAGTFSLAYSQCNFLIPLNFESLYGAEGAKLFGQITSMNAAIVIFATPLFTKIFAKVDSVAKIVMGSFLIFLSYVMYIFIQGMIPMYFVSAALLTFGEILAILGRQPYLTHRVPATHRGRISSFVSIFSGGFETIAQTQVGRCIDSFPIKIVWIGISGLALLSTFLYGILMFWDKKAFPLLSKKAKESVSP